MEDAVGPKPREGEPTKTSLTNEIGQTVPSRFKLAWRQLSGAIGSQCGRGNKDAQANWARR